MGFSVLLPAGFCWIPMLCAQRCSAEKIHLSKVSDDHLGLIWTSVHTLRSRRIPATVSELLGFKVGRDRGTDGTISFFRVFPLLFGASENPSCPFMFLPSAHDHHLSWGSLGEWMTVAETYSLKYYHWNYSPLVGMFGDDSALIVQWMMQASQKNQNQLGPSGCSCVSSKSLHYSTPTWHLLYGVAIWGEIIDCLWMKHRKSDENGKPNIVLRKS